MKKPMKREGAIRQQLKQVMYRHRKSFIEDHLSHVPSNCAHNAELRGPSGPLPVLQICRKEIDGVWHNVVCDPRFGGEAQAQACPHFCPKKDADSLKADFKEEIEKVVRSDLPIGILAKRYPDMVALLWVLGKGAGVLLDVDEDDEDVPEDTP